LGVTGGIIVALNLDEIQQIVKDGLSMNVETYHKLVKCIIEQLDLTYKFRYELLDKTTLLEIKQYIHDYAFILKQNKVVYDFAISDFNESLCLLELSIKLFQTVTPILIFKFRFELDGEIIYNVKIMK